MNVVKPKNLVVHDDLGVLFGRCEICGGPVATPGEDRCAQHERAPMRGILLAAALGATVLLAFARFCAGWL